MTDSDLTDLTDHEAQNRASWNADADDYQARHGSELAESGGLAWGTTQIPASEIAADRPRRSGASASPEVRRGASVTG